MPTICLSTDDMKQWTTGAPNSPSELLLHAFIFLKHASTKNGRTDNSYDASPLYETVFSNIMIFFSITSESKLQSLEQKDKGFFLDYSALLGAYFRSKIQGADGQPIVNLTEDQLKAVEQFVKPVVPPNKTPKEYLESFNKEKLARDNHKEVLKALIFKDIDPINQERMFKGKYKGSKEDFIEAILNVVDFMRTPFAVLQAEEEAGSAAAKASEGPAKTSGIDLQWNTAIKAISQSIKTILSLKTKNSEEALSESSTINELINKCVASYGIANARYQMGLEFAKSSNEMQQQFNNSTKQLMNVLGIPGRSLEQASDYFTQYVASLRTVVIAGEGENTDGINEMPFAELVNKYGAQLIRDMLQQDADSNDLINQWKVAYEGVISEKEELARKLQETERELQQEKTRSGFEAENQALVSQIEELRKQLNEQLLRADRSSPKHPDNTQNPLVDRGASSFNSFCTEFKEAFKKTNSKGVKSMMVAMDELSNQAGSSDNEKFKSLQMKMIDIAKQRSDRMWSKISFFGKGREPEVTELYTKISESGFHLDGAVLEELIKKRVRIVSSPALK